jgi:hypothetical protein
MGMRIDPYTGQPTGWVVGMGQTVEGPLWGEQEPEPCNYANDDELRAVITNPDPELRLPPARGWPGNAGCLILRVSARSSLPQQPTQMQTNFPVDRPRLIDMRIGQTPQMFVVEDQHTIGLEVNYGLPPFTSKTGQHLVLTFQTDDGRRFTVNVIPPGEIGERWPTPPGSPIEQAPQLAAFTAAPSRGAAIAASVQRRGLGDASCGPGMGALQLRQAESPHVDSVLIRLAGKMTHVEVRGYFPDAKLDRHAGFNTGGSWVGGHFLDHRRAVLSRDGNMDVGLTGGVFRYWTAGHYIREVEVPRAAIEVVGGATPPRPAAVSVASLSNRGLGDASCGPGIG